MNINNKYNQKIEEDIKQAYQSFDDICKKIPINPFQPKSPKSRKISESKYDNLLDESQQKQDKMQINDFDRYLNPKKIEEMGQRYPTGHFLYEKQISKLEKKIVERNKQLQEKSQRIEQLIQLNKTHEAELKNLKQEIQILKLTKYDEKSKKLEKLQKEIQFISQNNNNLQKTNNNLKKQNDLLKAQLQKKDEVQKDLNNKILNLEKQLIHLKKINKQLLQEQKNILQTAEQQVNFFKTIKQKFEKQNANLKQKINFLEIQKNTSVSALKNLTSEKTITSGRRSDMKENYSQVEKIKDQIYKIKLNLNELSMKKNNSEAKRKTNHTPIRK